MANKMEGVERRENEEREAKAKEIEEVLKEFIEKTIGETRIREMLGESHKKLSVDDLVNNFIFFYKNYKEIIDLLLKHDNNNTYYNNINKVTKNLFELYFIFINFGEKIDNIYLKKLKNISEIFNSFYEDIIKVKIEEKKTEGTDVSNQKSNPRGLDLKGIGFTVEHRVGERQSIEKIQERIISLLKDINGLVINNLVNEYRKITENKNSQKHV